MRNPIIEAADDHLSPQEMQMEKALRPKGLTEFAGQLDIVENLYVFIQAARQRKEALDHVLLHGPPGLGKTTLSHIIASELGANLRMTSGPVIEKPGDLAGLLTNLQEGDVLFIDEIHRLNTVVEEYLYSAMEDYRIDIMIETGPNARSVQRLELAQFHYEIGMFLLQLRQLIAQGLYFRIKSGGVRHTYRVGRRRCPKQNGSDR